MVRRPPASARPARVTTGMAEENGARLDCRVQGAGGDGDQHDRVEHGFGFVGGGSFRCGGPQVGPAGADGRLRRLDQPGEIELRELRWLVCDEDGARGDGAFDPQDPSIVPERYGEPHGELGRTVHHAKPRATRQRMNKRESRPPRGGRGAAQYREPIAERDHQSRLSGDARDEPQLDGPRSEFLERHHFRPGSHPAQELTFAYAVGLDSDETQALLAQPSELDGGRTFG